ncbi:RNA polymerase I-specific transcription initiation factor RRN6-like protein [Pyronema omphalodes]|nr:RNA polymerase I-specific transcription initiation factor RRN6-like protein [Pyronema omphalodes]
MNIAKYNPDTHKWHFHRQPSKGFRIFPLTDREPIIGRSLELDDPSTSIRKLRSGQWLNDIAPDAPGLSGLIDVIDNYLVESRILAVNSVSSPLDGRLMGFGAARSRVSDHEHEIAAFTSGAAGSHLILADVMKTKREFKNSNNAILSYPGISPTVQTKHFIGTPIRQVCFARDFSQEAELSNRLAIRTTESTKLYNVAYQYASDRKSKKIIQLIPLAKRSWLELNEAEHVDLTFSPWDDKQIGIVDGAGNWSIYHLHGRSSKNRADWPQQLLSYGTGKINPEDTRNSNVWGRIIWGADTNTIVACDRQIAKLFDIRTNTSAGNITLPVGQNRSWILDLRRGPKMTDGHDAFLLTSSHISHIDLRQPKQPLVSWKHERHHDDISMYLDVVRTDDVTTAFIGSRVNFLTTCYQFGSWKEPSKLGEPFILSPPFANNKPTKSAMTMTMMPCTVIGPKSEEHKNTHFFTGISINKYREVSQRLYHTYDGENPPKLVAKSSEHAVEPAESDDETEDEKTPSGDEAPEFPSHLRHDFSSLYKGAFQEGQGLRTVQDGDNINSIDGYCARIKEILLDRVERETRNLGVSSLMNVRAPTLLFDNLTTLETSIETLLASPTILESYDIKSLLIPTSRPSLLAPPGDSKPTIQTFYNSLIDTRITPLSETIPIRVRLNRERLSRLIATEIFLSSIGISVKPSPEQLLPPASQAFTPINRPADFEPRKIVEPLGRIRAYAHVQTPIQLQEGLESILDSWKIGENPDEFEAFMDPEEGVPRYRRDRLRARKEKERRRTSGVAGGLADMLASSQAAAPMVLEDAPATQGWGASQLGGWASQVAGSSQGFGSSQLPMSQVERGKHGSRKPKKKRKIGF